MNLKYLLSYLVILITFQGFSQITLPSENDSNSVIILDNMKWDLTLFNTEIVYDSLDLWKYNVLALDSIESKFLIAKIEFYRSDSTKKSVNESSKSFGLTFEIYPISELDRISKHSIDIIIMSSCCWPNSGPHLYTTQDFVFYSPSLCSNCGYNCNEADYCSGNIKRILERVNRQNFETFEELVQNLPIKNGGN
ncbi:hypothetical protein K6119_09880 [Paracrocinitomix mangrovi]|uniref:hypothetical protein n=1 Tax=Paracrocinitomix mangrovi TaxID=2862509 RepID=UPI001C8E85EF|nr:hypothetical protein [Paracrocinitomix mangrovi]UKN03799.1 hypothetical protein K6119_09880 [Paracrocinitomix mangrovi]